MSNYLIKQDHILTKYIAYSNKHPFMDGHQMVFRFPNGYGASLVQGAYSYGGSKGLFELAVVKFTGDETYNFDLAYDTPVANDVMGHLSKEEVINTLMQIYNLEEPKQQLLEEL